MVNIKNGDSIMLSPLPDGTLLINPNVTQREHGKNRILINADDDDLDELFRNFLGDYLAWYNVIEIRSKTVFSKELRNGIQKFSRMVIGPEIVEESLSTIVLRNLLDSSDLTMAKSLRRMQRITRDMQ